MNSSENRPARFTDPLDRARQISQALSEAARLARFSTRTRANYSGGGFRARRGAQAMHYFVLFSLTICVIIPSLFGFIYYGMIASDQYVAESKFSVIGNIFPQMEGMTSLSGLSNLSAAVVVQDTQIIVNYIESRAAIEVLKKRVDLDKVYSNPSIDWFARFDKTKPIEKFVRYWQSMVTANIAMPSGIVTLRVKAFSRGDAVDIANAVVAVSETLVNDMNARVNKDAVETAELDLQRATARLTHARLELERARNDQGILDANKAGDAINSLISDTRAALLSMQQEYTTRSKLLATNSPQMRVLKDRIDAATAQIAELQSKLTSKTGTDASTPTISSSISRFAELDLERQIAERLYAGAIASVEVARLASEQKQIYLNPFVEASLPQEAEYPKRILYPFLLAISLISIWGIVIGLITLVRNHMA